MKGGKLPTGGGEDLGHNPFASLSAAGLPSVPAPNGAATGGARPPGALDAPKSSPAKAAPEKNRGRVDIIRETGNRAGKTVTVVTNFTGIGLPEKESLAKQMRAACGCGGTVKEGRIEIQGDQRDTVAKILRDAGFRAGVRRWIEAKRFAIRILLAAASYPADQGLSLGRMSRCNSLYLNEFTTRSE